MITAPTFAQTPVAVFSQFQVVPVDGVAFYRDSLEAQKLIDGKKWAAAETLLRRLVAENPISTGIFARASNWGRLATALREQGKFADAIAAYQRVIALQGPGPAYLGWGNARYALAASFAAIGDQKSALQTLERLVYDDRLLQRPGLANDEAFASLRDVPRFKELAGAGAPTRTKDRVAGWRSDIDHLSAEVRRNRDGPLPPAFTTARDRLRLAVPKLSDEAVVGEMGALLATLQQGHTALWLGDPSAKTHLSYRPLPIRFYLFADGAFITQGFGSAADLAGARILRIGDVSIADAVNRIRAATSHESESELLWIAPEALVRPAVLKGLAIIPDADRATLTLRLRDGSERKVTLAAGEEPDLGPMRNKLPPPPGVKPPRFMANLKDEVHWFEPVGGANALYVQVNGMTDEEDESLRGFGLRLRQALVKDQPRNLILDIRHNNGGNSFQYDELLRTLIAFSAVEGNRVYVLIGRNVYSAAGNFTTDLERLVKPVFVGEPTGQFGNQHGDESQFILPYSGLTGAISGTRWQLSHPWDGRDSVAPDVPVQLTAAEYFAGRDPVLEAAIRLIRENPGGR